MTLTERIMGSIQANQGEIFSLIGAQTTQKAQSNSTYSSFDKILGSRLKGNSESDYMAVNKYSPSPNQRAAESEAIKADAQLRYRTFREANNCSGTAKSAEKCPKSEKTGHTNRSEKNTKATSRLKEGDGSENMIQVLAHMFGLNLMDLRKMLNDAGVDLESLNSMQSIDIQSIGEVSAALSQHLRLTGEQRDILESMLSLAWQLFEMPETQEATVEIPDEIPATLAENTQLPAATYDAKASELSGDAALLEALPQMTDESPLDQLSTQIKLKLDEYAKLLEEDNGSAEEELLKLLLPLLEKSSVRGQIQSSFKQGTDGLDLLSAEMNMIEVSAEGAKENVQPDPGDDNGQEMNYAKEQLQQALPQTPVTINESQLQPVFSAFAQINQVVSEINAESYTPTTTATVKEILSQIIGEAQVILSPEKSEMVMDLKPESLGRLSLKLITEKGIVMAKFVAESQQVREVLESNMQLLKDALHKQGLAVQDFSVSVRQGSAGFDDNSRQYDGEDGHLGRPVRKSTRVETDFPEFPQAIDPSNPYIWEASTINLTA